MGLFGYEIRKANKSLPTGTNISSTSSSSTFTLRNTNVADLLSGSYSHLALNTAEKRLKAYLDCPILSTVIGRKTNCLINGSIETLNANTGNFVKGQGKEWESLIANPNPLQTGKDFLSQLNTLLHIDGYAVVLKQKKRIGAEGMNLWVLPNRNLNIEFEDRPFYLTNNKNRLKKIEFVENGRVTTIDTKDVYLFSHLSSVNLTESHLPTSPLCGLEYPINNIIKAYESLGVIIDHRGAEGILSNSGKDPIGSTPVPEEEKNRLLNLFKGKYGLRKNQSRVIFSDATLNWQSTSMNVRDLMLNEEIQNRSIEICDKLGFPSAILGISKTSTYNNVETAEKDLYNNAVVPESEHMMSQLNEFVFGEDTRIEYAVNFKEVPVLQADAKQESEARRALNQALEIEWINDVITLNEWREAQEIDTTADGNIYHSQWIKQNETTEEENANSEGSEGNSGEETKENETANN